MKKWLKDRNLEPGPNNALKTASKAEMQQAVVNFKKALSAAGIELKVDAAHALNGLRDDPLSDEDMSSDDDGEHEEHQGHSVEGAQLIPSSSSNHNISTVDEEPRNATLSNASTTIASAAASSQPSLSLQLPAFLRPQPIMINRAEETRRMDIDRDESTLEIVDMLNMLKKSPMNSLADQQLLATCGGPEGILSKHLHDVAQKRKRQKAGKSSRKFPKT